MIAPESNNTNARLEQIVNVPVTTVFDACASRGFNTKALACPRPLLSVLSYRIVHPYLLYPYPQAGLLTL